VLHLTPARLPRLIEDEMRDSFIDYSMSVIVQRALPDVRDGLKPVHRRILFSMHETGSRRTGRSRRARRWWATCWASTTRTATRRSTTRWCGWSRTSRCATRWWRGRGTSARSTATRAAAYRYTEAKLAPLATEMLADIDKETVDFAPNFDDRLMEPTVLPAKVPNLLINGSSGIAVGMATNIPPHNLREVVDACVHLIDNPECEIEDLRQFVRGPDFPTGGFIYGATGSTRRTRPAAAGW
jgi:DNA gyrase subunit A